MDDRDTAATGSDFRVRLPERFTLDEAHAVQQLARRLPAGASLALDFTGVRHCQEVALLALAREVMAGRATFAFHGLTRHQASLFGYLGVRVEQRPEPEAS